MAEKTVPTTQDTQVTKEGTRSNQRYVIPPVDIYEDQDKLTVMADVPGAQQDSININVENNVLTIEAKTNSSIDATPIYREFEMVNFYRQFELSERVDADKISAELKNGVLTIYLPKIEQAKPRKIDVKVS